jgi:hypothetical protein
MLRERERALTVREREWMSWAIYVSGLANAHEIKLPPMPGSAEQAMSDSTSGRHGDGEAAA